MHLTHVLSQFSFGVHLFITHSTRKSYLPKTNKGIRNKVYVLCRVYVFKNVKEEKNLLNSGYFPHCSSYLLEKPQLNMTNFLQEKKECFNLRRSDKGFKDSYELDIPLRGVFRGVYCG